MNAVKYDVIKLVEKELKFANKMFPMFRSAHEGYAIIKEEVEECKDEMEFIEAHLKGMWRMVKANIPQNENAGRIKGYAINLAIEAIQIAAMAQKFIDSKNVKDELADKLDAILSGEAEKIKG